MLRVLGMLRVLWVLRTVFPAAAGFLVIVSHFKLLVKLGKTTNPRQSSRRRCVSAEVRQVAKPDAQ